MSAMVQASVLHFTPAAKSAVMEASVVENRIAEVQGHSPRAFPAASTIPSLPTVMRDEILDFYAFIFCQRGFHELGMTFEQFLLVIAAIKPHDLEPAI